MRLKISSFSKALKLSGNEVSSFGRQGSWKDGGAVGECGQK